MKPWSFRERVSAFAFLLAAVSIAGFALAWVFNWPSTVVLDDAADPRVGLEDVVNGTVTSIPLVPLVLLVLAAFGSRSSGRLGTAATVVLLLLGVVFTVAGGAEIASDNEVVSRSVLVVAGLLFAALGLALVVLAARALLRPGSREQTPRVGY